MAISLPDVTVVAIDTAAPDLMREALRDTLSEIDPGEVLVWSNRPIGLGLDTVPCNAQSLDDALRIRWYEVPLRIKTSHFLCIEWDSWALDGKLWRNEWLGFDYIGAPWWYDDGLNVGNGGFSLRSIDLARYVAANEGRFPYNGGNDDHALCRWYRPELEKHGFSWATESEAGKFSFEGTAPSGPTFGFHGMFNWPRVLNRDRLLHRIELATDYVRSKPGWSEVLAAARTGFAPVEKIETTDDPDPHLLVAGARIMPVSADDNAYTFALAAAPTEPIVLTSRTGVPSLLGVSQDDRRLGIAIRHIEVRLPRAAITFGQDAPLFVQAGCYLPEDGFCWTNGKMELPPWLFAHLGGPLTLIVHIERNGMRYPVSPVLDGPDHMSPVLTLAPATWAEKLARIRAVKWHHCMDFGDGLYTHDERSTRLMTGKANLVFKYPVQGKTVLDIGAWDGYFSFEAERRGASRVLATDHFCWSGPGWGTRDGFDLARELLGSRVEALDIDIPDISRASVGTFQIVMCLGVIYHVWNPLRVLQIVHSVTTELAIIESALDLQDVERPALSFVRGNGMPRADVPLSDDPTNFYGPNAKAVAAMLEYVGFSRIETRITHDIIPRGFFYAFK